MIDITMSEAHKQYNMMLNGRR